MPTYRIYYTEREVRDQRLDESLGGVAPYRVTRHGDYVNETEWEEEIEARDGSAALEAFFREHVSDRSQVMLVDDEGNAQPITGIGDYDPEQAYIWIENGKLMEYQGFDEATPGMVSCPLCEGTGEVTLEVADEYIGEFGEAVEEGLQP